MKLLLFTSLTLEKKVTKKKIWIKLEQYVTIYINLPDMLVLIFLGYKLRKGYKICTTKDT